MRRPVCGHHLQAHVPPSLLQVAPAPACWGLECVAWRAGRAGRPGPGWAGSSCPGSGRQLVQAWAAQPSPSSARPTAGLPPVSETDLLNSEHSFLVLSPLENAGRASPELGLMAAEVSQRESHQNAARC